MALYIVKVMTEDGIRTTRVEAPDDSSAERIASRKGTVISKKRQMSTDLSRGMSANERNTFMLRLSSMIGSKMAASAALKLIGETFSGKIKQCAIQMGERINQGMNLADAIAADTKNFPPATAALVKAGVAGGETWKALREAADFEYMITGIQKGAMKDIAAAIGTFFIAFGLMIMTVYYLGPTVTENPIFKNNPNIDVYWPKLIGHILVWVMGIKAVVFLIFAWIGTAGRMISPDQADKLILKIPYYKDLVLSRNSYVVLYKLALLVKSGIRIEECLALTADGSPKGAMRTDMYRALAFIRQGKNWANGMETLHPTDRAALSCSTDRTDTARSLDMLATQYRDLYMSRIKSFAPVMQTMAALYMSIAGAEMFFLTMLPMLQFSASI
ncbi:type II secretion system F family protein [Agrobacterium salinitolerans]|nr:type II secretion system F family protein [Agrobacterium salinitolerans]